MTVFLVNQYHWRKAAHCCEAIAYFSDRATAERYARQCDAEAAAYGPEYGGGTYSHDVEQITVNDPAIVARMNERVESCPTIHA